MAYYYGFEACAAGMDNVEGKELMKWRIQTMNRLTRLFRRAAAKEVIVEAEGFLGEWVEHKSEA